jgi:Tfp pilus assembly protein FimT
MAISASPAMSTWWGSIATQGAAERLASSERFARRAGAFDLRLWRVAISELMASTAVARLLPLGRTDQGSLNPCRANGGGAYHLDGNG